MVSSPPIPVPMTAPLSQLTRSSFGSGRSSPASSHASSAAREAWRRFESITKSSSWRKRRAAASSTPCGTPATVQPRPSSFILGTCRMPERPARSACANSPTPSPFGATTPSPVTTTRRVMPSLRFRRSAQSRRASRLRDACAHRSGAFGACRTRAAPSSARGCPAARLPRTRRRHR